VSVSFNGVGYSATRAGRRRVRGRDCFARGMSRQQLPYILAGVVLMTLQPILVTLSQDAQGHLEYSPISSTLLSGPRARVRAWSCARQWHGARARV